MSEYVIENTVQPITDDFSSDGMLDEFSRVDHQHPLSTSLRNKIEHKYSAIPSLVNSNNVSRGSDYGISFHTGVLNASYTLTQGGVVILTVPMSIAPIAGAMLDISWSTLFSGTLAGWGYAVSDIVVNSVIQPDQIFWQPINQEYLPGHNRILVPSPIDVPFNIQMRAYKQNIGGTVQALQTQTRMSIIYYR